MQIDTIEQQPLPFEKLTEDQRAEFIPAQIFELKKNEPAFIFSKENLDTIRRYEYDVRKLPAPHDVLANKAFAILGLNAIDVNIFFDNLRLHANSWDLVEDACKSMGAELQIFAENLISEAAALIEKIQSMDGWDSEITADNSEDPVLSVNDKETFRESVDEHLSIIVEDIEEKLKTIRHVKSLVDSFGDQITRNLHPMAKSLMEGMKPAQVSEKLITLEAEIAELDIDIQRMLEDYNRLVGTAFYGLVFGPAGLVITGGIYGYQAERIRAEKNQKIQDRKVLVENKIALMGSSGDFDSIMTHISEMEFRLVEVGSAIKNLEDVWVLLESYAKHSRKRIEGVSTQLALKRFSERFKRVVTPWNNILGISKHVSKLFNEEFVG